MREENCRWKILRRIQSFEKLKAISTGNFISFLSSQQRKKKYNKVIKIYFMLDG